MPITLRRPRWSTLLLGLAVAGSTSMTAVAAAAPGVTPAHYTDSLAPGQSVTIGKVVETPPIPPKPDIVFLADSTGSMGPSIANVKANATSILNQIKSAQPSAQFAVADFKDVGDAYAYRVDQQLTGDNGSVVSGINSWSASGGGDTPEAWIGALGQIPGSIHFRPGGTRVVVMFGDASSHDPSLGHTLDSATAALQAAGVEVIAIDVDSGAGDGLDHLGQASYVTSRTGGTLVPADPNQISAVILSQLRNLPATVTHEVTCPPGIGVDLTPADATVTSGDSVPFGETISLTPAAPQGQAVTCTVRFLVNGSLPGPEFVERIDIRVLDVTPPTVTVESKTVEATGPGGATADYAASAVDNVDGPLTPSCSPPSGSAFPLGATVVTCRATDAAGNTGTGTGTITVVDTTPPVAGCDPSSNPGGNVPRAGSTGRSGQNPDGFYRLTAVDVVDTAADVFVRDTGSGHVFGPYASGQRIKYTQAASGPSEDTLGNSDILHLTGTGDGAVFAVDSSGNTSASSACLVPAPPR